MIILNMTAEWSEDEYDEHGDFLGKVAVIKCNGVEIARGADYHIYSRKGDEAALREWAPRLVRDLISSVASSAR